MTLKFENVSHRYDAEQVLSSVSLEAHDGEILCLLGASGSGKTTLLRLAAGLEPLQTGEIRLDNRVLSAPGRSVPAEERRIGMVFQDHALFPHLDVAGNVGFGLNNRPADERVRLVDQALSDVGLEGYQGRFPHTLSGGQQQRVALARALAPQPEVILLDEPFASIDVTRRRKLRESARLALKQSGATTIMVTHDPEEALDMADRIAVMDEGTILQCAAPYELYTAPASALVAGLFGEAQVFAATVRDGAARFPYGSVPASGFDDGARVDLVIRPQTIGLETAASEATPYRVLDVRFRGGHWLVLVGTREKKDPVLAVHLTDASDLTPQTPVRLTFAPAGAFLFPAAI
mgnify:CR=1 FL=1